MPWTGDDPELLYIPPGDPRSAMVEIARPRLSALMIPDAVPTENAARGIAPRLLRPSPHHIGSGTI